MKDGKFTLKSDVWAFGVVLYEMLTLGQQPYAGLANSQVFSYVCVQKRVMARPKNCPNIFYTMMRACWMFESRDRPCFWQIVEYLRDQTNKKFHDLSFVYNDTSLKKTEDDYDFDRDWPADVGTNENSVNGENEEKKAKPASNINLDEDDKVSEGKFKVQLDDTMGMNDSYTEHQHNQHNHDHDQYSNDSCSVSSILFSCN